MHLSILFCIFLIFNHNKVLLIFVLYKFNQFTGSEKDALKVDINQRKVADQEDLKMLKVGFES